MKIFRLLVFLLFFIFLFNQDILRKIYNIVNNDYSSRIIKTYGYCSNYSAGFLYDLNLKYQFKEIPEIISYSGTRNPYWIFLSENKSINKDLKIFLDYSNFNEIYLKKEKEGIFSLEYIASYDLYKKNVLLINNFQNIYPNKIRIYKSKDNTLDLILEIDGKNLKLETINSKQYYAYYFLDRSKLSIRKDKIVVKIFTKNDELESGYDQVFFRVVNNYLLKDYKVLEQYNNCYLVKKL
jgi:hypothetical protein